MPQPQSLKMNRIFKDVTQIKHFQNIEASREACTKYLEEIEYKNNKYINPNAIFLLQTLSSATVDFSKRMIKLKDGKKPLSFQLLMSYQIVTSMKKLFKKNKVLSSYFFEHDDQLGKLVKNVKKQNCRTEAV